MKEDPYNNLHRGSVELKAFGPIENKSKAISLLSELGFELVSDDESLPWRDVFPELTDQQLPGICLQGARQKEGITQKQLADKTGIPQRYISEMENNKRPIGKKNAMKFAKVLNIGYRVFL